MEAALVRTIFWKMTERKYIIFGLPPPPKKNHANACEMKVKIIEFHIVIANIDPERSIFL